MATIQYVVNAVDAASATFARIAGSAEELNAELDEIGRKSVAARVGLEGDKEANLTLDKLDLKMAKLGKSVAEGRIGVEGQARAMLQIRALELKLDELSHKRVTVTIRTRVQQSLLSGLTPEGGGGLSGLLGPAGVGGLIGGGAIGAGLVPSVVGAGIGGLAGLGAVGGGLFGAQQGQKIATQDLKDIAKITTMLKTAVGKQRKELEQSLKEAQQKYAQDVKFYSPFLALQGALKGLLQDVLAPLRPVMEPLAAIFREFGKSLTTLGPQFTALFKASLPFIRQFLQFMLQAGKILLPAFTQALNEMVRSGALTEMTQALVVLTRGLATFIVNLGPGMKASSEIFARVATFIGRVLGALGVVFTAIAKVLAFDFPGAASKGVKAVVASFTWWRDMVTSITSRAVGAVVASFHAFWRDVSSIFGTIRSGIASAWNTIWSNTRNAVTTGISTVVGFFRGLPGKAVNAMFGLGHSMAAFMRAAWNEMWNAAKNVAGSIWHWLTGWVHALPGWLRKLLGISSPSSVFYDIGKQMMMGLFHGIQDHARHAKNAAQSAIGTGAHGGPTSASAAQAQRYAQSRLAAYGWGNGQMGPLILLWNQESGWDRFARNKNSGAYGIPQALPPGKMGALANPPTSSAAAQINWGLGYIRSVYGSPAGAWAHERAFNWYDRGGWLPPGMSLAYNATGQPEQVLAPGSMARVEALLAAILRATQLAPAATAAGVGKSLNGVARGAVGAR